MRFDASLARWLLLVGVRRAKTKMWGAYVTRHAPGCKGSWPSSKRDRMLFSASALPRRELRCPYFLPPYIGMRLHTAPTSLPPAVTGQLPNWNFALRCHDQQSTTISLSSRRFRGFHDTVPPLRLMVRCHSPYGFLCTPPFTFSFPICAYPEQLLSPASSRSKKSRLRLLRSTPLRPTL